jgi:hypothetical protein
LFVQTFDEIKTNSKNDIINVVCVVGVVGVVITDTE